MSLLLTLPMLLTLSALLSLALLPSVVANRYPRAIRSLVTGLITGLLLFAVSMALGQLASMERAPLVLNLPLPASVPQVGLYVDGLSSLMLCVIGLVGLVVSRYSVRYLDGETRQGTYFKWLAFTLAAVAAMVVSATLVQLFVFWVLTSLGLHQLLMHYHDRPAARLAAWTKFVVGRVGDACLLVAVWLVYRCYGTIEFSELFSQPLLSQSLAAQTGNELAWGREAIAWCLMLAAVTKSAQFPFHTWLPNTMETPTPVSALMHAGIVNGGGFLLIRTSPLFSLSLSAMAVLTVVGTLTACYGSVVMMTQSSVKRSLAYSTIAQMGFMMLQCGLGAFSAAMLHIVAHSLYKAYAFLMSGSLLTNAGGDPRSVGQLTTGKLIAASASVAITLGMVFLLLLLIFGANPFDKPGGATLAFALLIALSAWSWRLFAFVQTTALLPVFATIAGLSSFYAVSYLAVDSWIKPNLPTPVASPYAIGLFALVALAFIGLFVLQTLTQRSQPPAWLATLRVHAMNGFYLDAITDRWWPATAKV